MPRSRPADVARRLARWLRGVRARLVATFVLAATAAALGGTFLFVVLLTDSLRTSVDGSLRTTSNALAADIRADAVGRGFVAPHIGVGHERRHYLPGILAVYTPAGTLAEAEPSRLPARPIAGSPTAAVTGYRDASYAGQPFRILVTRVRTAAGRWLVVAGQNRDPATDATTAARRALYLIVPVAVVLSGLGAWLLAGGALRPVDRMRRDAQRLSETDRAGAITVPDSSDSLNALALTFNALLDRLHASAARQRNLVADAGHELRTPLTVLRAELDTAVRPNRTREDLVDSISHARREVARLAALSDDLLLLAQADGATPLISTDLTDVGEVVDRAIRAHTDRFAQAGVRLSGPGATDPIDIHRPVLAEVDPIAVRRILDNLLANALRHTPHGGWVDVAVSSGRDALTVAVSDSGPGFADEFVPHAFERFSRADTSRRRGTASTGSGLGLAIVKTLVTAHGGDVSITRAKGGGARVDVTVPMHGPVI